MASTSSARSCCGPAHERLGLTIARWEGVSLQSIGTALEIPAGKSYDVMAQRLATEELEGHVFEIYAAQGKLSNKLFRIFNMGEYPPRSTRSSCARSPRWFERGVPL